MGNLAEAKADIKPAETASKIRRIVTGHDENGLPYFWRTAYAPTDSQWEEILLC